jgi:sulfur-oxidizing protein SoxY
MTHRRELLQGGASVAALMMAAGLLPRSARAQAAGWPAAAFDAKTMADVMKALGASAPAASAEITVQGPDIAENGAVVPLGAATALKGVKRLALLVEKNPNTLSAVFDFTDAVEPSLSTRVKMSQSSNVFAVAMLGDGRVLFGQKEIKVTLGGCGG